MAFPSLQLIESLRETARRLRNGSSYAWGNHGTCWLKKNLREDVVLYFETFAALPEEKLIRSVRIDYNILEVKQEKEACLD